jgi:phage tail-like protein
MPRQTVDGLGNATPIVEMLPGMLQDDPFAQRFASAFDDILAPVLLTLDCVDSYFDPWLAPKDFLEWLASWVAVELDETLPPERQRLLVSEAVRLYRVRGTAIGLAEQIAIYTGLEVEIEESGGATWSAAPGGYPPGEAQPRLLVKLISSDPESIDISRVNAIVGASKPAQVPHTVVVLQEDGHGGVISHVEAHQVTAVSEVALAATAPAEPEPAPAAPQGATPASGAKSAAGSPASQGGRPRREQQAEAQASGSEEAQQGAQPPPADADPPAE